MVGDNYGWDVAGASEAGLIGVFLDRRGCGLPAGVTSGLTITSLLELP
jgi:FMN phosphatase YigB (HAD superfamily)